ncbi:MAG: ATP-binding protein [Armatimonadota bacterium]
MSYISRALEPVLERAAREFPAVVLTGARQTGKTTLLQHLFGERYRYVSLEAPDTLSAASADPRGFLQLYAPPVILDEVQNASNLLPYIKESIDTRRERKGQFILSGSQNLLMMQRVSETLAGRCAVLRLMPLSFSEMTGAPQASFVWERDLPSENATVSLTEWWERFLRGTYPEIALARERDFTLWYASYVQTYLERDVRALRQVGDLLSYQTYLRVLAARSGQLLNLSDISRDLGISVNTAKAWLSVLEATHQVIVLRPYHENVGKRLVKTPKVYFVDTGLLCYLVGLRSVEHAIASPMAGAIVETAVISEVVKRLWHRGEEPRVAFWRTASGQEVDLLVEQNGKLVPIEVKATATPRPGMASGLQAFLRDYPHRADRGWLVHLGTHVLPLAPGVTAVPLEMV